jgi:CPA1 family monovalent cation:H+ antiporter
MSSAFYTAWREFRRETAPIASLALGSVIFTTACVGCAVHWVDPQLPWAACVALGAIVSPPDAVAAKALLGELPLPERLVTVLEGESLVNDASGLVLYKFAVAAVMTGAFSLIEASAEFVGVAAGGIVVGVLLARLFIAVHRRLGDVFIEVLTTLAVPYVAYIVAESLHVSGVLAVVTAGLVRGRYAPVIVSAEMRIIARSVWNMLVFLLNSLIFMLIGIQLSEAVEQLVGYSGGELFMYGMIVSAMAIAVRFAWVYPATFLPRILSPALRAREPAPAEGEAFIMSWCGMRGIVSLAAALALPVTLANGQPFPQRDLIIFLTFIVIAVTLVVQGLSLPPLIRGLKVGTDRSLHDEHRHARLALGAASLAAIDALATREHVPAALAARVRAEFAEKIERAFADLPVAERDSDVARQLRQAAIDAERRELIRIWRENQISDEILHHIEKDLDYQQAQI